ncbi:hypothetical protein RJT34_05079 [Clitoria ternatea]|uniref:F-box domain-containing protein n=1 Tax=Clitoria ternatea TaxID=43366 RepID=A0AAN9K0P0_CLITE
MESSRLCDLPDAILQEIISNLPPEEAVRTSVLSRQWVDQWMGISKLELDENAFEERQHFINVVEKLRLVVSSSTCLRKFSLVFEVGDEAAQVNQWLSGFIKPKIEDLNLDFERVEDPLFLPSHLFTSKTLKNFRLNMQNVINLPSSIYFQSLKTLTLNHVTFPGGSSTQKLFSSCPVLEELILLDCSWRNVRSVRIDFPMLRKLIIREWKDDDYIFLNDLNGPFHCQIMILGNNLKTFYYDGDLINDYFLHTPSPVTDATVEVHPADSHLNAGYFVLKLLRIFSNVEKLGFTDFAAEALSYTPVLLQNIPFFRNLIELRVVSVSPIVLSCAALLTVLRNSPRLNTIEFVMGVSILENGAPINPLPACFETHLKVILICGFSGSDEEMLAIRFLLLSAPLLETFYIYCNDYEFDSPDASERLDMLFEKIISFPKVSEACNVVFD